MPSLSPLPSLIWSSLSVLSTAHWPLVSFIGMLGCKIISWRYLGQELVRATTALLWDTKRCGHKKPKKFQKDSCQAFVLPLYMKQEWPNSKASWMRFHLLTLCSLFLWKHVSRALAKSPEQRKKNAPLLNHHVSRQQCQAAWTFSNFFLFRSSACAGGTAPRD